ncbi:alpha/beta hydrolase [Fulvimarina sp. MAC8]|uniref:alpha/beta hydrolase n=1 Tax=Fulvimarina sp. MAC8 TaxID=3162874 RepID=UPI0032EE4FD7
MAELSAETWTAKGEVVADFDAAYDNRAAVTDAAATVSRWPNDAAAFRERLLAAGRAEIGILYGSAPRQRYDLFRPEGEARGLVVFIHGGYWKSQDVGNFSHFAGGPLARGYAVALPEYTLCPDATIPHITQEIGGCLDHVTELVAGPIRLSGHSAGGHLATRMICADAPIAASTAERVDRVVSISGLHDLRPIMRTAMNEVLRLDVQTARAESPALLEPRQGAELICVVGADELPELRRQNALLPNVWSGFGLKTRGFEIRGRHHLDVIDALRDARSDLVELLAGQP